MDRFSDLERWLDRGISEDPLMLHGTSIEAVFELANTGKLPTSVFQIDEEEVYEYSYGSLFFTPVTSRFKGEKYERLVNINKENCIKDVKTYAGSLGFIHYLAHELNCQTAEVYNILQVDWFMRSSDWKDIQSKLKKHGIEVSLRQVLTLHYHAEKRKGVIIEPDESILELPNEVDIDDNTAITVGCPDGLDKKYISGIELLGLVERRLMRRFLEGKLEYKGFKTEKPPLY